MRYLKTYEQIENKYTYTPERENEIRKYAIEYFETYVLKSIDSLIYKHFEKADFDPWKIFAVYLIDGSSDVVKIMRYFLKNPMSTVYRLNIPSISSYCRSKMRVNSSTLSNITINKIVEGLYKEYNIEDKLIDKYVSIVKEDAEDYLKRVKELETYSLTHKLYKTQVSFYQKAKKKLSDHYDAEDMGLF